MSRIHETITKHPVMTSALTLALGASLLAGCESGTANANGAEASGTQQTTAEHYPVTKYFGKFSEQNEQGQRDAINSALVPTLSTYISYLLKNPNSMNTVPTDGISSTADSTIVARTGMPGPRSATTARK